jgi:alkanesulfonate monooxygenase SsuD/methylene tetrahydromethanopterin reductase-like flavin-dependent oxidoreductase (luciferase family)
MKYGFVMPPWDAREVVEFACEAEQAGWDGFFVSEVMWSIDTWICLTAAAMQTEHIRLGTLLSPLSCMRPWKLAIEAATLDYLSKGRVILTVGLGAPEIGFAEFGEVTDLKTRAELVDEGLDILNLLWRGQPFEYKGKHYTIDATKLNLSLPPPIQQPRIPIWVVAAWPRPKSMRRALRCDGLIPMVKPKGMDWRMAKPDDIREMKAWIEVRRTEATPFDIVIEGQTPGDNPAEARTIIHPWTEAGATWWIESLWGAGPKEVWLKRLRQGPPSL